MKQFSCGDIVPGCKSVFRAETEPEIMAFVADHAHRDHGMTEIPVALVEQVRGRIIDTVAA